MEDIINKLAEIEAAASHIMEDVSEQKKQLAQQYEEAVQQFHHRHGKPEPLRYNPAGIGSPDETGTGKTAQ